MRRKAAAYRAPAASDDAAAAGHLHQAAGRLQPRSPDRDVQIATDRFERFESEHSPNGRLEAFPDVRGSVSNASSENE